MAKKEIIDLRKITKPKEIQKDSKERKEIIRLTCEKCWHDIEIPSDYEKQKIIPACPKCKAILPKPLITMGDKILLTGKTTTQVCDNCGHSFEVDMAFINRGESIFCPECDEEVEDNTIEEDDDSKIMPSRTGDDDDEDDEDDEIEDPDDTEE